MNIPAAAILVALTVLSFPRWRARRAAITRVGSQAGKPPTELRLELLYELVAAAMNAGLPVSLAITEVYHAANLLPPPGVARAISALKIGEPASKAWSSAEPTFTPLVRALIMAEQTGAAVSPILRNLADDLRRASNRDARIAARKLGVRLTLPLGLTILPAFFLLAIGPVILGLSREFLAT